MNLEELKFGIRLRDRNQNHSQIKINIPNKNRRTNQGDEREDETEPSSPNPTKSSPPAAAQSPLSHRHSHEHRQTSLSRNLLPPPARHHLTLSHAAVSPSLSCFWFCFHVLLSVWFFYCFIYSSLAFEEEYMCFTCRPNQVYKSLAYWNMYQLVFGQHDIINDIEH
jgi:hypothetical protein